MPAILFGSISTIVDTSEVQRCAFNDAFASHGLDWTWEQEEYRTMLGRNGGGDRIAAYAAERGVDVDADAVHATKSEHFHRLLVAQPIPARTGVEASIRAARARGIALALVTTTSAANVAAVLASADLGPEAFDVVLDADQVRAPKPDPEGYALALRRLELAAASCVAVEDNPGGIASATAAGVVCVAFPNTNTGGQDLTGATVTVDRIGLDELLAHLPDVA